MTEALITPTRRVDGGTVSQILDIAERLVQTRGFNDFSYADIAAELGVAKPSLHYHFRTKATLGEALIARYAARFYDALEGIDAEVTDSAEKLERYTDLYRQVLAAGRMCLCGILAAEYHTIPDGMKAAVVAFFDRNEGWLEDVLDGVESDGSEVRHSQETRDTARAIIDTLEGAVMIARAQHDVDRFDQSARRLLASVASRDTAVASGR